MTEKPLPRYVLLPTSYIIEVGIEVQPNWYAVPNHDGWLVPEKEYEKIVGRPN